MTSAIPVHIGLVDDTGHAADLSGLAAALNEQIQADFAPVWHVRATVAAYTTATVPPGCWAVRVKTKLDEPGALGYHSDANGQPYAVVELTDGYEQTVSHEVLEMLVDPFGFRLHSAELPDGIGPQFKHFALKTARSRVRYLLEVCDPPERFGYLVGGKTLSDFVVPYWYRTMPRPLMVYSHAGGCTLPREVAEGGYVSFENPTTGQWYQVFNEGGQLTVRDLGQFDRRFGSLREWADHQARVYRSDRQR